MQQHIQDTFHFFQVFTSVLAFISMHYFYKPCSYYGVRFMARKLLLTLTILSLWALFFCYFGVMTEGKTFHSLSASLLSFCARFAIGISAWVAVKFIAGFDKSAVDASEDDGPFNYRR